MKANVFALSANDGKHFLSNNLDFGGFLTTPYFTDPSPTEASNILASLDAVKDGG